MTCRKCEYFRFYPDNESKGFCRSGNEGEECVSTFDDASIAPFKIYPDKLVACNRFKETKTKKADGTKEEA